MAIGTISGNKVVVDTSTLSTGDVITFTVNCSEDGSVSATGSFTMP